MKKIDLIEREKSALEGRVRYLVKEYEPGRDTKDINTLCDYILEAKDFLGELRKGEDFSHPDKKPLRLVKEIFKGDAIAILSELEECFLSLEPSCDCTGEEYSNPCLYTRIKVDEIIYERGKVDSEKTCHDCGISKEKIHHLGCDMEECPRCKDQLIFCSCEKQELLE